MKTNPLEVFKKKPYVVWPITAVVLVAAMFIVFYAAGIFSRVPDNAAINEINQNAGINGFSVNPEKIRIIPLVSDSTGVSLDSEFKLLCNEEYSDKAIEESLSITPKQSYKIKAVSKKEFLISFDEGLKPNSIYRFAINEGTNQNRSWAFQTKKTFSIVRTLPRNEAVYVPVNSGIEITFSHDNIESIEDYFEITPNVNGRFEYHKKTVVFVPQKLEEGTVYTVKIKAGLGLKGSEQKLENDYVFKFQTELSEGSNRSKYFSFSDHLYNFTGETIPFLEVNMNDYFKDKSFNIEIFAYPDFNSFMKSMEKIVSLPAWARFDEAKTKFDTSGLEKVGSFETKIVQYDDGYWIRNLICFPEGLPEGYYLIKSTCEDLIRFAHIQVNNMSVHITVAKKQTLIWVNDAVTGNSIENARIDLEDLNVYANTDKEGIAVIEGEIPAPSGRRFYNFKVSAGNRPKLYAPAGNGGFNPYDEYYWAYSLFNNSANDEYWRYLYLDRDFYLPDDTVSFWGIIKPRNGKNPPSKAVAELHRYDYSNMEGDGMSLIDSTEVEVSRNGAFEGQFTLSNYNSGSYYILIKYEDMTVINRYFSIREYTKPAYKVDLQPDKKAAFAWEDINIDIQASFFEGTPVPGLELRYYYYLDRASYEGNITCDENGSAGIKPNTATTTSSWRPLWLGFYVNNTRAEEEEIRSSCGINIFPKDTMIEIDSKTHEDGKAAVNIKTSGIDLSKIRNKNDFYFMEDDYRGSPVDTKLTAIIYERYWDKREIGDYYDFINKRTYKKYDYFEVKNKIQEFSFNTTNGEYKFDFPVEKDKYYVIEVRGYDSRNGEIVETGYVYGSSYYYNPYYYHQKGYYLTDKSNKTSYKLNDNVSLSVMREGNDIPRDSGVKFLYIPLKSGIIGYDVSDSPQYSFTYKEEHIPNIYVKAVCFDGRYFHDAGMVDLRYDYKEKELKISITPDKNEYKPGDTVNLKIDVNDAHGNPCPADINVSVVDEAFFAMQDQYVDTLASLYGPSVSPGLLSSYISHDSMADRVSRGGAEQGEGGDEVTVRQTFKDTAFFRSIKTDENGKAELSFKLPDNLTSWRITYQGISSDLKAGNGKINVSSKLPFFVDTIFGKVFIKGDTPEITLRSFGSEVKSTDKIKYIVKLEGQNGDKKEFSAEGAAESFTNVFLGKLEEGSYSITVEARYKNYSDAVKRQFDVVESTLEATRINYHKLEDGLKIEGGKSLTTLTFYNNTSSAFYQELNCLAWSWGQRVDQELSRIIARNLLKKYYDEEIFQEENFDLQKYQLADGGIALLSYDSSSPELSAKICSLGAEYLDKAALKHYFYNILNNYESIPEDVAASYWGLAALNEPVLIEIQNLLQSTELGLKEKLYLAIALAELGDYEGAGEIYTQIIKENSKASSIYTYIETGKDRDDVMEATSLCSIIALKLRTPEASGLFNYVKNNSTSELLLNLERLIYVTNHIPEINMTGKFSYELDGEKKDVTLNKFERFQLVLTPEKLEKIKFYNVEGDIAVTSRFISPMKDLLPDSNKLIELSRAYSVNSSITTNFRQSDLVKITLSPKFSENAPDGYYEITDVLPSCLRYVSSRPTEDNSWYPDTVDGQKVTFGFYYNKKYHKDRKIVYYARAVTPGEFTADNALMKHYLSDVAAFAEKTQVRIHK